MICIFKWHQQAKVDTVTGDYLPVQWREAEPLACAIAAETVHFPLLPHFLLSVVPMELPGSSLEQGP